MSLQGAPIRAVQRALLLIRVLNEKEVWTLQDLQARTELPKSTLHRLLLTLQAEHYVYSGEEMYGKYRLTHQAKELNKGVTEKNRLADISRPIVISATKASKWPMAVGVIDGSVIRVNVCSMPYSPYAMRPTCLGQTYDLFTTALGNAYLSYCSSTERRILIELMHEESHADSTLHSLRSLVRSTRKSGFSLRAGRRQNESSAIAVPIYSQDAQLVGVLGCSTFSHSLSKTWITRILPLLQNTAREISNLLDS